MVTLSSMVAAIRAAMVTDSAGSFVEWIEHEVIRRFEGSASTVSRHHSAEIRQLRGAVTDVRPIARSPGADLCLIGGEQRRHYGYLRCRTWCGPLSAGSAFQHVDQALSR
jgi:hypothetical protein